ncbi:MAG TPA: hypothetical protein VK897_25810 [Anaerolineales bacterium]|nr:hypothetical protein [Anaerolineales bacterium]
MIRVLVLASDSLLGDAIVSNLVRDTSLEVSRLTEQDLSRATTHADYSVVIIVEEAGQKNPSSTAENLLRNYSSVRIITISSQRHSLHVCDRHELPISGMKQVIYLAKSLDRQSLSEVRE